MNNNGIMNKKLNITVVGFGYVGMSLSLLFSQEHKVKVLDIDKSKVNLVNSGIFTSGGEDVQSLLNEGDLNICATQNPEEAYKDADFIIIATPTDFDPDSNYFNTTSVDKAVAEATHRNQKALIVIKSTIPVGHTEYLNHKHKTSRIIFSPEFLREGRALYDNLHPSRIVIGGLCDDSMHFANLLRSISKDKEVKILVMSSHEAESVKLFSNTFLAMRVSFFNELDSFALAHNLKTENIINGVCLDKRIGDYYNNPSFGYGGYCLPKDTKQLLSHYVNTPQNLIDAIIASNSSRKDFIASEILKKDPQVVGFYRLTMKHDSDNFRSSSIQGILRRINKKGIKTVIYEPLLKESTFYKSLVVNDLQKFKDISSTIVANRYYEDLCDVKDKVFTRDIFEEN